MGTEEDGKGENINTDLRGSDEFKRWCQPTATEDPGWLPVLPIFASRDACRSAGTYRRSARLVLSNNDDLPATLLPRESVAFRFPFWHRRGGRQEPLPVRMRV